MISSSPSGVAAPYFYHSDHLGSSSLITDQSGSMVQHMEYVPYGETFIDERRSASSWTTPYQFSGKERDEETGLLYFGARYQDSKYGIWYTVDPLAEKHPEISPYVYCAGNPVNLIDPDGRDWYKDKDNSYQYNPALNKNNASKILTEGQSYAFRSKTLDDKNGTANYRRDGSIMYSNETDAYNRMQNQATGYSSQREFGKGGREEMCVIKDNEVLVLPDWNNSSTGIDDANEGLSKSNLYGYKFKDGMFEDAVTGETSSILGTIHTHQNDQKGEWGFIAPPGHDDNTTFPKITPNVPYFTMGYDNSIYGNVGNKNGRQDITLPNGYNKVSDLTGGARFTLFLKRNIRK